MIQNKTLPLIVVATMAPTSKKAARPANSRHASHDAKTMKMKTSAPTTRSPWRRGPKTLQITS